MDDRPPSSAIAVARAQRDQARGCAWLAGVIAVAVVWSNSSLSNADVQAAQTSLAQHQSLVTVHEQMLTANETALAEMRAALARLRPAAPTSP